MAVNDAEAIIELQKRRRARESLLCYATYTNSQYVAAPHHTLIANALERVLSGDLKRLIICMPPRHGKSELASRRFPAYYLGHNPSKQVIAASYNSDLAADFGREVRNIVASHEHKILYPETTLSADSTASNRWHTSKGGMYVAAGVGTAITGRGADLFLIDDPFKDRQEADSEITRQRVWDWYTSTAYTRLMPGGAIVLINCMVGSTKVLMSDGKEKLLMNIKIGDSIATYDNGVLSNSIVKNWINQGSDKVFTISTSSGITVTANKRHPFLIERNGEIKWIRLAQIKEGDRIVRLMERGKVQNVPSKDATGLLVAKDIAHPITIKQNGQVGIERHPSIKNLTSKHILDIDTELITKNTQPCLIDKMACVQSAELNTQKNTGERSYVSTMITKQEKLEDYYVMPVTLLSDQENQTQFYQKQLNTSEFTLDTVISICDAGIEDVFDIQVEKTENFIANGLVSHNTRWHDDDLTGRLLESEKNGGDKWEVICLPAIDENNEALWPEWYPLDRLEQIKSVLPSRDWNSLYQQNPIPEEGDFFKKDWFAEYDGAPSNLRIYGASDFAVTDGGGDFTEHGIIGVDQAMNIYVLDWWFGKTSPDVWIDKLCDLVIEHKPIKWFGESGVIRRSIEPSMLKRMNERDAYGVIEWIASINDKATRARGIQARASMGKVFFPKNAKWKEHVMTQLFRFPAGKHDDAVDVLSLFGRGLDHINAAKGKSWGVPLKVNLSYIV